MHPLHVYERSVGFASLRNFGRPFYKASMPYPQVAGSPSRRTKKIIPRLLSERKCSGVSNCGRLGRRVLAPTLCDRHLASLHVYERSVGFASLRNFGRSFYKASMPYPQVAGSPTHQHTKGVTPLIEWGYTFWCRWRGSNPHGIATNGF